MKKVIILLATMAFSGGAIAGPAWTYVDAGYLRANSGDDTADGYSLMGSFGLDIFHVNGEWVDGTDSDDDDFDGYRIGAGIHPAITDATDLVLEIGYSELSWDDFSNDPSWIDLTLGVRSMISDSFELNSSIVTEMGDSDTGSDDDFTEIILNVGGQYFFTDNISLNATVGVGSENNVAKFGARWSF